jgi:hypothetical protein
VPVRELPYTANMKLDRRALLEASGPC